MGRQVNAQDELCGASMIVLVRLEGGIRILSNLQVRGAHWLDRWHQLVLRLIPCLSAIVYAHLKFSLGGGRLLDFRKHAT